jgi:L-ascorbate metabolism protein UlaG (beta-lactamase superfamily)
VRAIARAHPRAVWVTPLGNGAYIAPLGVSRVRELDWWQDVGLAKGGEALTLVCTPAQHRTGGGVARSECPRP